MPTRKPPPPNPNQKRIYDFFSIKPRNNDVNPVVKEEDARPVVAPEDAPPVVKEEDAPAVVKEEDAPEVEPEVEFVRVKKYDKWKSWRRNKRQAFVHKQISGDIIRKLLFPPYDEYADVAVDLHGVASEMGYTSHDLCKLDLVKYTDYQDKKEDGTYANYMLPGVGEKWKPEDVLHGAAKLIKDTCRWKFDPELPEDAKRIKLYCKLSEGSPEEFNRRFFHHVADVDETTYAPIKYETEDNADDGDRKLVKMEEVEGRVPYKEGDDSDVEVVDPPQQEPPVVVDLTEGSDGEVVSPPSQEAAVILHSMRDGSGAVATPTGQGIFGDRIHNLLCQKAQNQDVPDPTNQTFIRKLAMIDQRIKKATGKKTIDRTPKEGRTPVLGLSRIRKEPVLSSLKRQRREMIEAEKARLYLTDYFKKEAVLKSMMEVEEYNADASGDEEEGGDDDIITQPPSNDRRREARSFNAKHSAKPAGSPSTFYHKEQDSPQA